MRALSLATNIAARKYYGLFFVCFVVDFHINYVENNKIYKFLEEIKSLHNNIKDFETADDITSYLREQFAGLMKLFL